MAENGCQGRIVSIQRLKELGTHIKNLHEQNLFDEEFYNEREFSRFEFQSSNTLQNSNSIIVVAYPDPQFNITFNRSGKEFSLIVPPTYLFGKRNDEKIREMLLQVLEPKGYNVVKAMLPLKLLAVRSGLAQYGKNNISYIPEMGSFFRLTAFFSNFPCEEDSWQDPQLMGRCEKCSICQRTCPTNAITSERFLLHAERCITYLNEKPGHVLFPDWFNSSWHNCLVGCLLCQEKCPSNKGFLQWIEQGAVFSERETSMILDGIPKEHLPSQLINKLRKHDMLYFFNVIHRNLTSHLQK